MKYSMYEGTYACVKKAAITVRDMEVFVKTFSDGIPRTCKEMAKILYADFEEKEYMQHAYIMKISQFMRHLMENGLAGYIKVTYDPIVVNEKLWVRDVPESVPYQIAIVAPSGKKYVIVNPEYQEYVRAHAGQSGHWETVSKTITPKPTRKYFIRPLEQ